MHRTWKPCPVEVSLICGNEFPTMSNGFTDPRTCALRYSVPELKDLSFAALDQHVRLDGHEFLKARQTAHSFIWRRVLDFAFCRTSEACSARMNRGGTSSPRILLDSAASCIRKAGGLCCRSDSDPIGGAYG
ncbi:hypothetical protein BC827DRAFT_1158205 [Russula dissimulans]|nr:hypothetical protein BC827DRAFT_1158205 [Russula dissimulans]